MQPFLYSSCGPKTGDCPSQVQWRRTNKYRPHRLQENPIPDGENLHIPKLAPVVPPQGDTGAIAAAAKMLVEAQNPLIICDRMARTPAGMANLVELAETLQCGVIDNVGRMNFPSRHPLNQSFCRGIISQADVILAIEMNDLWGAVTAFSDRIVRRSRPLTKPGAKIVTLGVRDLYLKSNYQDFGRFQDIDLDIAGDGEASLPALTEAVKRQINAGRKSAFEARGKKLAALHLAVVEELKSDATIGWDASPITTARMCAEVYAQIKDEDWSLVGTSIRLTWPHRMWDFKKPHQWNGFSGGAGVGYTLPASLGAALANKKHGRNGKRLYLADGCFTCHGRSGQGGAFNGPAPSLAKTDMPFDGFKAQLRDPANDMPAYSTAVVSDQEIADMYAFVQSLPGARSAKDISILND